VSGQERRRLRGHETLVLSVAFAPDGQRLASASGDGIVLIWDVDRGTVLRTFERWATCLAFSPNGRFIAGSGDGTVFVCDSDTNEERLSFHGHSDKVTSVAFSHDGRLLASGSSDASIRIWCIETGAELLAIDTEIGVSSVAFSHDGSHLASNSDGELVALWDARTGERVWAMDGNGDVAAIAAGPKFFRHRLILRRVEAVIETSDAVTEVAWLPLVLSPIYGIATHAKERTWAVTTGNHLFLFSLEGDAVPAGERDDPDRRIKDLVGPYARLNSPGEG
jgi:WD40 repeat protein